MVVGTRVPSPRNCYRKAKWISKWKSEEMTLGMVIGMRMSRNEHQNGNRKTVASSLEMVIGR